jgi:hypothetical protein
MSDIPATATLDEDESLTITLPDGLPDGVDPEAALDSVTIVH